MLSFLYVYSDHSILECYNLFSGVGLSMRSFFVIYLKLCAEVWKTRYECSLNPGNENSKLEMETPKFPSKIDFNVHWKSSSFQTETSDFRPDFLFSFLNSTQPTGWIFKPGRPLPLEIWREELVDLDNALCSLNAVSRTVLLYEQKNSRPTTEPSMNICMQALAYPRRRRSMNICI